VSGLEVAPLLVFGLGLVVDLWVYADAKQHADRGNPVVFQAGNLVIETPAAWAAGCLIFWVVFFPLSFSSRG
jgi:cytochrome c oxidase assembly factor CtaG